MNLCTLVFTAWAEKTRGGFGKSYWGSEDLDLGRTKTSMLCINSIDKKHQ